MAGKPMPSESWWQSIGKALMREGRVITTYESTPTTDNTFKEMFDRDTFDKKRVSLSPYRKYRRMVENPPAIQKFFEFIRTLLTVGEYIRPVLCGHDYGVKATIGHGTLDVHFSGGDRIRGTMVCRIAGPGTMVVEMAAYNENRAQCNLRHVTVTRFTEIEAHILADYLTAAVWLQAESEAIGKADYLRQ